MSPMCAMHGIMVVDDNIVIVGHAHMVFRRGHVVFDLMVLGIYQIVFHNMDNIKSLCSFIPRSSDHL